MKTSKSAIAIVVVISVLLSLILGILDYETQSLYDLFFGDSGNIIAIILYASIFSCIGFFLLFVIKQLKNIL